MTRYWLAAGLICGTLLGCSESPSSTRAGAKTQPRAVVAAPAAIEEDTIYVPADSEDAKLQVLETGVFHHEEVPKNAARHAWLGLFRGSRGYYLATTAIRQTPEQDVLVDEGNERTGWQITTPGHADLCLLLLRPQPGLVAGPVDSLAMEWRNLEPGRPVAVSWRGQHYQLVPRAQQLATDASANGIRNYKLYLTAAARPGVEQLLAAVPAFNDAIMRPVWAGDLDHDGQPDYILDTTWHYNVRQTTVYLSGQAGPGELVKFAGMHTTTGC